MLKKVSILVAVILAVTMLLSAVPAFAAEAEEEQYVRFTATGNDPYATFSYSSEL